jgi:DNA-binding HxlR family transcriptional regulator
VRSYGQYCPIARGAEIFAERWTPIILRNVLYGCRTFSEIAAGAPGLSRALLTRRLHELAAAGIIQVRAKPNGRGSLYEPTPTGQGLLPVLHALAMWADEWMDVKPEHSDPQIVVWAWSQLYLRREALPDRRVVVRFDCEFRRRRYRAWMLIERGTAELCAFDPGFGDDLVVTIHDTVMFARWHLGLVEWATLLRSGAIEVTGPSALRRALPTWNSHPESAKRFRAAHRAQTSRLPGHPRATSKGLEGHVTTTPGTIEPQHSRRDA